MLQIARQILHEPAGSLTHTYPQACVLQPAGDHTIELAAAIISPSMQRPMTLISLPDHIRRSATCDGCRATPKLKPSQDLLTDQTQHTQAES